MTQAGAELEWQPAIVKMSISLGNQTIISGTKLLNPAIGAIQNINFCKIVTKSCDYIISTYI